MAQKRWNSGPVFYLLSWSPSHLEIFFQGTWKPSHLAKSQVTSVADLEISGIALSSLFVFCIFLTSYMWHYMVCFTIYERKAVSIIFTDKLCIRCYRFRQHRRLFTGPWVTVGAAFSDVPIDLTRDVTIVLTLVHGNVNNASLGKQ